jgi:hypothetical protein
VAHRESYQAEDFERRSEAAVDEDLKEPVPVSASQLEWGVAERESVGRVPKVKAKVKRTRTAK